jgi:hypothetical protein
MIRAGRCAQVLRDGQAPKEVRRARAQGMRELGGLFLDAAAVQQEVAPAPQNDQARNSVLCCTLVCSAVDSSLTHLQGWHGVTGTFLGQRKRKAKGHAWACMHGAQGWVLE